MRIIIAAVGRWKKGPEKSLFDEYIRRLPWQVDLIEVEEKRAPSVSELKEREAELLLKHVPPGAILVALDEFGKTPGSVDFSKQLEKWRDQSPSAIVFAIGGANGHGKALKSRANYLFSLGALTWPHMLVRPMIAEQLFRANAIMTGHPYHRA